jgi:hypothetical protein
MDGVKPVSVGPGSILRGPALVGRADRVQIKPQPAVSINNGSRLGLRGLRPVGVSVGWQGLDAPGDPNIRFGLADRILDRASLLSVAPRKFAFRSGCYNIDPMRHIVRYTS